MPTPAREPLIRLGLQIPSFTYPEVPDDRLFERVAEIAKTAERSGFDSVWVMDHFYQIPSVGTARRADVRRVHPARGDRRGDLGGQARLDGDRRDLPQPGAPRQDGDRRST